MDVEFDDTIDQAARDAVREWSSRAKWHLLPDYMRDGIFRYVAYGTRSGDFLMSVYANDLFAAVYRADDTNIDRLTDYAFFFYNYVPRDAYGSPEKREAWIKAGGIVGRETADA